MEDRALHTDVLPLNLTVDPLSPCNRDNLTMDQENAAATVVIVHDMPSSNTDQEEMHKRKADEDFDDSDEKRPRMLEEGEVAAQVVGESLSSMEGLVMHHGTEDHNVTTSEGSSFNADEFNSQLVAAAESTQLHSCITSGSSNFSEERSDADPVSQCWFTTKEDKDTLAGKGLKWKQGMWSKDEIAVLEENIGEYVKMRGVGSAQEIIFDMTKDERKDFYRSIAKGLQRPLFAIYRRVLRMYDTKNHMGKYTLEETERLKDLHLKHGNDWAAIGTALGRSASSVKDRCRLVLKESNHSGKWSPEEEHRLADSVHSLSRTVEGESVTSGISWAAVAERVGTRSEKQCRSKWLNYLNWKQIGGTDWVKEDDLNLINRIEEMGVENDNDILWNDLCSGWSSVRSPQWLRSKWWALKRHVPNHATMNLPAIIERLKTHPGPLSKPKPERPSTTSTRLRVARLDQTYSALKSPQIVHVPIPIPQTGTSATITTTTVAPTDSEDENSSSGHQYNSYEVMQSTMTLAPGTFLIHNPHHAVALSGSPTSSDQIIVHTVPVSDALHSNENVTVQMNPQNNAQIIITSTHPDCVSSLGNADMTAAISQSDDLQHVSQSDEDLPSQITQSDLATQQHMHSQDQLMTQDGTLIEQDISGSDMTSEVSQSEPTLVIVSASSITGTTRAEYVQSTSSIVDSHLTSSAVFTLTGPILQSHCDGGDDMIGSSSDIETDKLNKLDCCDSQDTDLIKHDSCGV